MKKFTLLLVMVASMFTTKAQSYDMAAGLRLGYGYGLTFKKALSSTAMFEGILSGYGYGGSITGLYEINQYDVFDTEGLNWYYGGGAHVGSYRSYYYRGFDDAQTFFLGVDGILGIEYNLKEYPFNASLDWKPGFNLIGYGGFYASSGALSVRYLFN